MTPSNAGLKEIHEIRLQLEELKSKIDAGPRQIAAREKTLDSKRAEVESRRTQLKQLKVAAEQKSLQLKSNEGKIYDLEGKLNIISTNREYDALRTQIAADKMANSVLEGEIIEALEKIDEVQLSLKEIEKELETAQAEVAAFTTAVKQREPGLKQEYESLLERAGNAESSLPPDIAQTYRRLVNAYGAKALSPVTAKSCGICYVGLTAQTLVELKSGKFKFCSCGRLLYFVEPSPA